MSRSSAASDLAMGRKFTKQLMYVQKVDKEKDAISTISQQSIREYFLRSDIKRFSDSNLSEYLKNPKANLGILKSSLQDKIYNVEVYSNPLPIPLKTAVTIHAFVVFLTENLKTKEKMWYSMEKNGQYIVLQQSPNEDDVTRRIYDAEKKKHVKRLGPVKQECFARGNEKDLEYLIRAIWKSNQLNTKYHLLFSNCQHFASFVIEKASFGGKKWSTWISAWRNKKIKPEFEADRPTLKYNGRKDAKFAFYKAMADEGKRQDFEELAGNLTGESLNSVDSQGYTLLEWATVFSTSNWPIDQFLIEKGAEIQTDKKLFRRNVFFIALQYLPSNKESRYLSFDGINIHDVNRMGDSALHLALYGEKWDVAEKILDEFPDYDVNVTNSSGHSPFDLAVQLDCKMILMKKILDKTSSENINAQDEYGENALHLAIFSKSQTALKELLNHKDVDVNVKNYKDQIALHFACVWKDMPIYLFKKILENTTDVNAQDKAGYTALHRAILLKTPTATKELLRHKDVDVSLKNNENLTALYLACCWNDIPINLFSKILGKSTDDINAQDKNGDTVLYEAIIYRSKSVVEELLKRDNVDVNVKNNDNQTALHLACCWEDIPIKVFTKILEKSTNDINAQDKDGRTALHFAIFFESKNVVKELLKRKDVDVNVKDIENNTPLNLASRWNNIPIDLIRIIFEKSTYDINAQDNEYGWNNLHLAIVSKSHNALKELLKRKDVDVNVRDNRNRTALHFAAWFEDMLIDVFNKILEKSTDVNAKDANGNTALQLAIVKKFDVMIKELLNHKDVNVNLPNIKNQTALHWAARRKDIPNDLFTKILEKTTNVNAQDEFERTALHWVMMDKSETAVKELLKRKDVDVNVKDKDNLTAFDLCSEWQDIPVDLFNIIKAKATDIQAENEAK